MPITLIFFRPISHVFYPLGSIQPGCGFWCLGLWGFTSGPIYMMTMTSYIISSFKSSIYNLGIKHLVLMVLLHKEFRFHGSNYRDHARIWKQLGRRDLHWKYPAGHAANCSWIHGLSDSNDASCFLDVLVGCVGLNGWNDWSICSQSR